MSKAAVIYWSGTGNTEAMARAVAEGAKNAGAEVDIHNVSEFDSASIGAYDAIALGCPAMGNEVLEESEFEPFYLEVKPELVGRKVGLFGSYGWGDGEWMRQWETDCAAAGITLAADSVICVDAPDDDAALACNALGAALA